MIYKNLYIIGNGFDQHHDIRCGFVDFMKWVKKNDAGPFFKLTQVYNSAWEYNWWRDFENSLAQLNISYYANKKGNLYDPEYIKEGSIEEKTELASRKVVEEFDIIKNSLRHNFQKWLSEAYENSPKDRKIHFPNEDCIFLTFNYTKTLEDIYKIDAKHVYHIHGVFDDKESMIVGHGLGIEALNDMLESLEPRIGEVWSKKLNRMTRYKFVTPAHKELATLRSLESLMSLKKDVEGCIEKNKRFFNEILDVQKIYVYGFSFSSIDMPYLEKIIRRTKPETHWVISWYSQDDRRRLMDFVIRYDIQNITMINGIKYLDIHV
jgi:hypothetical protein